MDMKEEKTMPRKGENIYKLKDNRLEGCYIVAYNSAGRAVYKSAYGKKVYRSQTKAEKPF